MMPPFAYYLLKVLVCSALFYTYYVVALRNSRFHQYNRFYLMSTAMISWLIPSCKLGFWHETGGTPPAVVQLLSIVANTDVYVEHQLTETRYLWDWNLIIMTGFVIVSCLFVLKFLISVFALCMLSRSKPQSAWQNIRIVYCRHKLAPFSFFNYVFWHSDIALNSPEGIKIFQHELAHIQQKHSLDKICMTLLLAAGWYNPFFWLMNRELKLIHEFIADSKAITDGDTTTFSAMLLKASYPAHDFSVLNPFFYSPVKRRLLMLTKSRNTSYSYLRRLSVLPLMAVILLLFAFKFKTQQYLLEKKYIVVIDAGHGGKDGGATGINAAKEKDVVLNISHLIKKALQNNNIDVILTRETDQYLSPQDRVHSLTDLGADLFISLHTDVSINGQAGSYSATGAEIVISKINNRFTSDSRLFGSILSQNLEPILNKKVLLVQKKMAVFILDNQQVCPSVLLECGYISAASDYDIMTKKSPEYAQSIAKSIANYFSMKENQASSLIELIKEEKAGKGAVNTSNLAGIISNKLADTAGAVYRSSAKGNADIRLVEVNVTDTAMAKKPWVVLDGVEMSYLEFTAKDLNPALIKSINVYKDKAQTDKYGQKAIYGVIEVITSNAIAPELQKSATQNAALSPVSFDRVFTQVENPPYFEDGMDAFAAYILKNMVYPAEAIRNDAEGAVLIQFMVDTDGKLVNFTKQSQKGFGLEEEAIRLIKQSEPWKPGLQNGHKVVVQVTQQVIFKLPGKKT